MSAAVKNGTKSSRTFLVGVIGVGENEYERLSRVFAVTNYRTRAYKLVNLEGNIKKAGVSENCNLSAIDIFIVNSDDQNSLKSWQRYLQLNSNVAASNVVYLSSNKSEEELEKYCITLPINPSRVLKTLDKHTIKELNYFPEFEIGHEGFMKKGAIEGIKLLSPTKHNRESDKQLLALVVDDSIAVRRQLEIEFNLISIKTVLVANGEKAIDVASKQRFDIIFLDVVMSGIDGYAVCKKIKKSELNKTTPVILLTSRSGSFDKIRATLAGCDTFLTKPIGHNEFESVVSKYL